MKDQIFYIELAGETYFSGTQNLHRDIMGDLGNLITIDPDFWVGELTGWGLTDLGTPYLTSDLIQNGYTTIIISYEITGEPTMDLKVEIYNSPH